MRPDGSICVAYNMANADQAHFMETGEASSWSLGIAN